MARDPNKFTRLLEAPGAIEDHFLYKIDGHEELSQPFRYRLQIRSQGAVPDAADWVGAPIVFVIGLSDNSDRRIAGRCMRFEHVYQKGLYTDFAIEIAASLDVLHLHRNRRLWTDVPAKAVVADVLRGHGVIFDDSKVGPQPTRSYCVQQNETDFDFVSRLLEDEGVFYYFRFDEGAGALKHKMVMADSAAGYENGSPFNLSFRRDHQLRGLHGLELAHRMGPGGSVLHEYNFKKPGSLQPIPVPSRLGTVNKGAKVYEWQAGYEDPEVGRRRAKLAIEEAESGSLVMEGKGSYLALQPGGRFQVDDTRLEPRERRIVIRSVDHAVFNPYGLNEGEPYYRQTFSAQPSADVFRPKRVTPKAQAAGPQTAVVVDQDDGEGFGRVKVQFHWDVAAANTAWMRVMQQFAGQSMGGQWIPREGMEVVVDFLEGDPDRPVVVGCLYNGKNPHPYDVPAHLTRSGWRTQGQGGKPHELYFEDKPGGEEVYMLSGRDYRRVVKRNEKATITDDLEVTARTMTFTAKNSIKLNVGGNEVVINSSGVTVNGTTINLN